MIFHKALVREFAMSALATFFVLLGIMFTMQLVRLLGQAATGLLTSSAVFALLGFTLINYLSILLSLTIFIAVLMTLTRSYRDSEMVVWFASGMSLTRWIRPVLTFAVPLVVTVALLSLVVSPWAYSRAEEVRRVIENREDIAAIMPGVFRESSRAARVYFVEDIEGSANMVANVFVSSTQHQRLGVTVASRGFVETAPNGDRFLVLLDGRRYEGVPGSFDYRVFEFERYAMRVEVASGGARAPTSRSAPTLDLVRERTPRHLGELSWRIGLPVSAFILCLLAIPLSFVNPRAGRSMNIVLALLIYMTYSNLLSVAQASIAQSRVSFWVGLMVHLAMLGVLVALFARRLAVAPLFRPVR